MKLNELSHYNRANISIAVHLKPLKGLKNCNSDEKCRIKKIETWREEMASNKTRLYILLLKSNDFKYLYFTCNPVLYVTAFWRPVINLVFYTLIFYRLPAWIIWSFNFLAHFFFHFSFSSLQFLSPFFFIYSLNMHISFFHIHLQRRNQ